MSRFLLEQLQGYQLVKKFPVFHVNWRFVSIFKRCGSYPESNWYRPQPTTPLLRSCHTGNM